MNRMISENPPGCADHTGLIRVVLKIYLGVIHLHQYEVINFIFFTT